MEMRLAKSSSMEEWLGKVGEGGKEGEPKDLVGLVDGGLDLGEGGDAREEGRSRAILLIAHLNI